MPRDTQLSSKHSITAFETMLKNGDQVGISQLIRLRLTERYVTPATTSQAPNGFASLALACLLIETIQSFRAGVVDTKGQSGKMFDDYFAAEAAQFGSIAKTPKESKEFYEDVRCGLLHTGETRGGWHVTRGVRAALFDPTDRQINADLFLCAVQATLNKYCDDLETLPWSSEIWDHCRTKMAGIVQNCAARPKP